MDAGTGSSTGLPAFGDQHSTRGALKPAEIVLLSASHKTPNPKIIHEEARVISSLNNDSGGKGTLRFFSSSF